MLLIRRVLAGLVGVILALGAAPFQRIHEAQFARDWSRPLTIAHGTSSAPLRREPNRPAHDSTTCVICMTLHSPAAAQAITPAAVNALALLGWTADLPEAQPSSIGQRAAHCRGPPII